MPSELILDLPRCCVPLSSVTLGNETDDTRPAGKLTARFEDMKRRHPNRAASGPGRQRTGHACPGSEFTDTVLSSYLLPRTIAFAAIFLAFGFPVMPFTHAEAYSVKGAMTYEVTVPGRATAPILSEFELLVEGCTWSMKVVQVGNRDYAFDHYSYDGTNLVYYSIPRDQTFTNVAARVESVPVPHRFSPSTGDVVWLAFASGCYLKGVTNNSVICFEPLRSSNGAFRRWELPCKLSLLPEPPYLPQHFELTRTNLLLALDDDGNPFYIPLPNAFPRGFVCTRFESTEFTNVSGLLLPSAFEYTEYRPAPGAKSENALFCSVRVRGTATLLSTTKAHPDIVLDARATFPHDLRVTSGLTPMYRMTNGVIPALDSSVVAGARAQIMQTHENMQKSEEAWRHLRRTFLWMLVAILVAAALYSFARRARAVAE